METTWRWLQFVARARAIARWRWIAIAACALALLIPGWAEALGLVGAMPWLLLAAMGCLAVLHHLLLPAGDPARMEPGRRRLLRAASYLSLCLDTLAALYLVAATGGLRSPFLAVQVGLVALFALLFPRPLAALPALALLPALAQLERSLGTSASNGLFEPMAVLGYGALDLSIILLVVGAARREEAHHAGLIRLERAEAALALAEERARLSREIHDGLGAALTGLAMQAEVLVGAAPEGTLREEAQAIRAATEEALGELRQGLRVIRGDFSLRRAARSHCEEVQRRARADIRFRDRVSASIPLPGPAQLSLFRLLQEALSNALRHAEATAIDVVLAADAEGCLLSIRDDGRGFDPSLSREGRYGLRGMQERALELGGALELISAPGRGTDVRIAVPFAGRP